ncbi:MAG: hypothetical protein K9G33_14555 [Sneathiella sp.]|nr:hypothetical protein [Sneathiella sp.]
MKRIRALTTALAVTLALPLINSPAARAGFEDGVKAYEAKNYKLAFEEWLPLAKANDPAAMRNIGHMYRRGLGVPPDYLKAMTWYKRAATLGFDRAQANVAGLYLNGEGVKQSYAQAANWFAKAAQQGHVVSQYNLGLMFENGLGVKQDDAKAIGWFELAAKAGHPQAMEKVAELTARQEKSGTAVAAAGPSPTPTPTPLPTPAPTQNTGNEMTEQAAVAVAASEKPQSESKAAALENGAEDPPPIKKMSFYEALRSLVVTEKPATEATPVDGAAKAEPSPVEPVKEIPAPAPAVEKPAKAAIAPVEQVKTASVQQPAKAAIQPAAKAAPAEPVKLAAVPPAATGAPQQPAATVPAGTRLTTAEKLEMADLAYTLKEYQQSLGIWATLAKKGNAEAQYKLGTLFNSGVAVPLDRVRAYYWWEKAKENGFPQAADALASLEKSLTHLEKRQIQRTN